LITNSWGCRKRKKFKKRYASGEENKTKQNQSTAVKRALPG